MLQFVVHDGQIIVMINGLEKREIRPYTYYGGVRVGAYAERLTSRGSKAFAKSIQEFNGQACTAETIFLSWDYLGEGADAINKEE